MIKDLCFEITQKCLNNCKFCSSNSNCDKTTTIEFTDFKKVIDHFIKLGGIEELSISGGEPFLHKDILKIIEYAKSKNIKTVIFTSGVIKKTITQEFIKNINTKMNIDLKKINEKEPDNIFLKRKIINYYKNLLSIKYDSISKDKLLYLKKIGLNKIVFDYQGYEYTTDHFLMGRTEEARQAFLHSLIISSTIGLNIDIHFIPMKPNYKEIGDILEILEIAKIKQISILNFLPQGRGKENKKELQLSHSELNEFFTLLNKYKNNYSGNIRIGIPLQNKNTHKCNAGLEKLDIKFDGTVLPCPAFKEITKEECIKYNINLPNIYSNLKDINIPGEGTRVKPLCKQIYKLK